MIQEPVREVYAYLDAWAGEKFSAALVERITRMPTRRLRPLIDDWPPANGDLDQPWSLDVVEPGTLRPVLSGWSGRPQMLERALRLLLYVDSVVVESDVVDPFMGIRDHFEMDWAHVYESLRQLAVLRPLVIDESVRFAGRWRGLQPSRLMGYWDALKGVPELAVSDDPVENIGGPGLATLLAGSLLLVEEGKGTPIAISKNEELAFAALFGGRTIDGRTSSVTTLARLDVPDFLAQPAALITLRQESEVFAEWRNHLKAAIQEVRRVPESSGSSAEVGAALAAELESRLAALRADARRSPALIALQAGVRRLGFLGIGAGAGAGVGTLANTGQQAMDALIGAASGAAANIFESISDYLKARRRSEQAKLVWEVAVSFRGAEGRTDGT